LKKNLSTTGKSADFTQLERRLAETWGGKEDESRSRKKIWISLGQDKETLKFCSGG